MTQPALRNRAPAGRLDAGGTGAADERPAIDLIHLARQTLGDRDLEMELLGLFTRQARALVGLLETAARAEGHLPSWGCEPLHTLCGSARVIGCWDVARGAQSLEEVLRTGGATGTGRLDALRASVDRACAAIDHMLED